MRDSLQNEKRVAVVNKYQLNWKQHVKWIKDKLPKLVFT